MQEKLSAGTTYRAVFKVDAAMIEHFADLSGDRNPIHMDADEARAYGYPRQVAHGALLVAFLSRMIGMEVPGPGAVWMSQSVEWLRPVFVGDEVELAVTIEKVSDAARVLGLSVVAMNAKGEKVMQGEVKVKVSERVTARSSDAGSTDRVALISGGSRGIGAAIALRLAKSGMRVVVNYRRAHDEASAVVAAIQADGGEACAIAADVGDHAATADMIDDVVTRFGRLDVVVHGASPTTDIVNVAELGYGKFEPYLKVYLGGASALVACAAAGMIEREFGRFIFLGTSFLFGLPPAGLTPYVAAKQALWGFVRCAASELALKGITTNMVSPGLTVTDFTADIPARVKEVEARKNPTRRLATANDTAELVNFLASEEAGYINGANLPLTGGSV